MIVDAHCCGWNPNVPLELQQLTIFITFKLTKLHSSFKTIQHSISDMRSVHRPETIKNAHELQTIEVKNRT